MNFIELFDDMLDQVTIQWAYDEYTDAYWKKIAATQLESGGEEVWAYISYHTLALF